MVICCWECRWTQALLQTLSALHPDPSSLCLCSLSPASLVWPSIAHTYNSFSEDEHYATGTSLPIWAESQKCSHPMAALRPVTDGCSIKAQSPHLRLGQLWGWGILHSQGSVKLCSQGLALNHTLAGVPPLLCPNTLNNLPIPPETTFLINHMLITTCPGSASDLHF